MDAQQPLIQELFCFQPSNDLLIFELESSPFGIESQQGNHPDAGVGTWTTRVADEYDWLQGFLDGAIDATQFTDLSLAQANAALLIGEFTGTCSSATTIAIWFSTVGEHGQASHWLVPIAAAPSVIHELLEHLPTDQIVTRTTTPPCDICDYGCCYDTYQARISEALSEFTRCAKDLVPPLRLSVIACFVLCTPFLVGSPAAYALCVEGCIAASGLPGTAITFFTCKSELESAKENARVSYCACLVWKAANCSGGSDEIDLVGCE